MMGRRILGTLAGIGALLPAAARAQDAHPAADPAEVQGVDRPAEEKGDTARAIGGVLLYVPRAAAEAVFLATGTAAGLVQNEQVVPRVRSLIAPRPGQIGVYPTAFVETGVNPNIGAR